MHQSKTALRAKYDGQQAYCSAYANATNWQGVVYLSLIGYRVSVLSNFL